MIKSILKKADDDVEVGEVLGILEEGAVSDDSPKQEASKEVDEVKETPQTEQQTTEKITPGAKKWAEEFKIDICKSNGTGPSGRITKEDVQRLIEAEVEEAEIEAPSVEPPVNKTPAVITPSLTKIASGFNFGRYLSVLMVTMLPP